jgi:phytoene dehydrogenase-like protein
VGILLAFAPYEIDKPWPEARDQYTEGLLEATDRAYPGFREGLTFCESAPPTSLERFTLNRGGAIYGWDNTPDQIGKQPSQQTPIDGLFLAGQWTAPGSGFVRAVLSGARTAQLALDRARTNYVIPRLMSA